MIESAIQELKIDKSDWTPVKFGDVVFEPKENAKDIYNEGIEHVVGLEHIDTENIHLTRSGKLEESTTFSKKFSKGDVLFGRRRAYLKKAAQASFSGICSGDITVFRAKENLMPELLPFIVCNNKFFDYAVKHSAGGLSPRVKFKDLANYEFLLPPKDQQAQLAELLWAMDEVIEREREVLERLKTSSQVFFENEIIKSKGKKIPLAKVLIPKKSKSQVPHTFKKYIGLEHIKSGASHCTECGDSSEVLAQCNIIEEGDLCYSKLRPYLDKAFIAEFEAVSTTELLIYDTKGVSKEYVLNHFHSRPFIQYVTGKGFGTKMPRVSDKIIGEFEIKVLDDENGLLNKMRGFQVNVDKLSFAIESSLSLQKSLINQIF
ncbi:MAG: restriction endonuclease subunit S [Cyclobacteriaceae bacterium]